MVECHEFDQYTIKLDGTGRLSLRNQRFLRNFTLPHSSLGFNRSNTNVLPDKCFDNNENHLSKQNLRLCQTTRIPEMSFLNIIVTYLNNCLYRLLITAQHQQKILSCFLLINQLNCVMTLALIHRQVARGSQRFARKMILQQLDVQNEWQNRRNIMSQKVEIGYKFDYFKLSGM